MLPFPLPLILVKFEPVESGGQNENWHARMPFESTEAAPSFSHSDAHSSSVDDRFAVMGGAGFPSPSSV